MFTDAFQFEGPIIMTVFLERVDYDGYESLINSGSYNSRIIGEAMRRVLRQCLWENEDKYRPNSIVLIMGKR